jgi:ribokinase
MARVVVLGSSGYDLTIHLPRLPRPGETLLGGELKTGPGGKGANAAVAAARAGGAVVFLTAFGDDAFGREVADHDREEGIDLSHAHSFIGTANQVALIFVGGDGENLIGVAPGASASLGPEYVEALPPAVFTAGGVLLACLEVPLSTVARGLSRAREAGMTTILNPAPADRGLLENGLLSAVDVLTPNQEEARVLTGIGADDLEGAARAADALRDRGAGRVVITLGEAGCLVVDGQAPPRHVPGFTVRAIDTVGAGDAFNGALAVALAEGRPLDQSCRWACAAAALAVTRPGAQGALPGRSEIDRMLP